MKHPTFPPPTPAQALELLEEAAYRGTMRALHQAGVIRGPAQQLGPAPLAAPPAAPAPAINAQALQALIAQSKIDPKNKGIKQELINLIWADPAQRPHVQQMMQAMASGQDPAAAILPNLSPALQQQYAAAQAAKAQARAARRAARDQAAASAPAPAGPAPYTPPPWAAGYDEPAPQLQ